MHAGITKSPWRRKRSRHSRRMRISQFYVSGKRPMTVTTLMRWVVACTNLRRCLPILSTTVRCRYNAVNFLQNYEKRHPEARPLGRDMGSLLHILTMINILPPSPQRFIQLYVILDRIITVSYCTCNRRVRHSRWKTQLKYANPITFTANILHKRLFDTKTGRHRA